MTEDDRVMLEKYATLMGPTLCAADAMVRRMNPVPRCVVCPSAQWYLTMDAKGDEELEAFCTQFRSVMYDGRRKTVTACDAWEDAIRETRSGA